MYFSIYILYTYNTNGDYCLCHTMIRDKKILNIDKYKINS